jgi:hypothetical protein
MAPAVEVDLPREQTTEFLLSAEAAELVPAARVLEERARAERLAVPGRAVRDRAGFQEAREDQAVGDRVEPDQAEQDPAEQDEDRDRVALLERLEAAVEKLRAEEAETAADLTRQAVGVTQLRECVEQAGLHEAVWARWRLKPD